jgi:hypothetical protein
MNFQFQTSMQRLKNLALLIVVFVFFYSTVNGQHVGFIYGHALYAGPLDKNFSNNYNSGLGIEGGGGFGWNKTFIVGTIGYTNFFHKSISTVDSVGPYASGTDLHFIPLKVGLRQYIFLKTIYLHGDVGLGSISNKTTTDSRFSGDVGAGFKFAHFEVQVDYDGFTRKEPSGYSSWFSLKAGLEFGL